MSAGIFLSGPIFSDVLSEVIPKFAPCIEIEAGTLV